jgi:Fe2+ or Zn2+ uptake regulation protein
MTEELEATLHQHGYSVTKPRKAVFAAMQYHEPQTISELVQGCIGVDRASIYRTIELYERLAIVQRLHLGWKYKLELTDNFTSHHHHATCVECSKTVVPFFPKITR